MAKKQYLLSDLEGRAWVVKPGDPAYDHAVMTNQAGFELPVFPNTVVMSGNPNSVNLGKLEQQLGRLTVYLEENPDPAVQTAAIRLVAAIDCLALAQAQCATLPITT